ncbi:MAG: glycerate kinase, partial [Planctomycetes bacterium]|nr:glycerate kinase [Planctomycetota bacterium]
MKIVVAMDSFKESLSAETACDIVAGAIVSVRREVEVVVKPMADGGEGTARALIRACGGEWIAARVMGPLSDMEVEAGFAWFDADKTALVEMATASGLELLRAQQRNPLLTTTYGTGQLIAAAIEYGARKVYLAVGGSATVDGAVGAAGALGWTFLDDEGKELPLGGGQLGRLRKIIPPRQATGIPVEVLCDVDNPLCGRRGAARVYAPQKGATPEMAEQLEAGLLNLAAVVREQLSCDIQDTPGAGAAGGLAGGAVAFMDARLISGVEFI